MKSIHISLLLSMLIFSCSQKEEVGLYDVDPAYAPYIAAYTNGLISNSDPIEVFLQHNIELEDSLKGLDEDILTFKPSIKGKLTISKDKNLVFVPSEKLPNNTLYTGTLKLQDIDKSVPDSLSTFQFKFQTLEQDFEIKITSIQTPDSKKRNNYTIEGEVIMVDKADSKEVENIFASKYQGENIKPIWTHKDNVHTFKLLNITREDAEKKLSIHIDGDELDVDREMDSIIKIPKKDSFKVISVQVDSSPEQCIKVNFSDPIKMMDFAGYFELEDVHFKSYIVEGNLVKVYPAENTSGEYKFKVWKGIENVYGDKLQAEFEQKITLNSIFPEVELIGSGNIVPNHYGVKLPFKAIGLKAVDVKVTKVFENNIHQFFQFNDYDGSSRMRLVGRDIYSKTLSLSTQKNFNSNQSQVYQLDISQLVKNEPGAIYHIEFSFKKEYSVFPCVQESSTNTNSTSIQETEWEEGSDWNSDDDYYGYDDDYDYYYEDYDWQQRNNPCHSSYYTSEKNVSRNILATNIGLTAKIGKDKKLYASVNDLITTKTLSGVKVTAYDLQKQWVGDGKTNGNGLCEFSLKRKPYLIVADDGKQKTYLKVDDGSVLNYSQFDIDGTKLQKGLNGFIYGERGVWRPGDSIFLTFVAHSPQNPLPENMPAKLDLYNVNNQLIDQKIVTKPVGNFYAFKTATTPESPTGNYLARVSIGGVSFEKTIKIETIKPNRLKINVDVKGDLIHQQNDKLTLSSHWLTGLPAKDLKIVTEATFITDHTGFKGFENYIFDDPSRKISDEKTTILDGKLDANGKTTISKSWKPSAEAPGMLQVGLYTRVFEKGGDFSSSYIKKKYSPFAAYVGLRLPQKDSYYSTLETDKEQTVALALVDENGNPKSGKVEVTMYKIESSWWYNSGGDLAYYVNESYHSKFTSKVETLSQGKGSFSFTVPREEWGNYFIRVVDTEGGHAAGTTVWVDWPDWRSRGSDDKEAAALMRLKTEKQTYQVGDKVEVTIPESLDGKALVSYENGYSIIKQEWIDTKSGSSKFSFKVTEEMAPNIYVSLSMIQPHSNTTNDLPIRMYGIVPLDIINPKTKLQPNIKSPDEIKPNASYSITVQEDEGKEMYYTLAVVDEGLLDLTNFSVPNIYAHFNAKQSLGIKTWDVYNYVLGAYGGRVESVFAIGGDKALQASNKEKINRFKPVVTYLGPFKLKKNGKNTHQLQMENYIGSVKVMVVAGNENAFGSTEKSIKVVQPVMTLSSLPRVVSPGDEVVLPITVFAMKSEVKNVEVQIDKASNISLVGANKQQVSFSSIGEKITEFRLKVPEKLGKAQFEIKAKSGSFSSYEKIEIEVRSPNPPISKIIRKELNGVSSLTEVLHPVGMKGTQSYNIELSALPISNINSRLDYLIHYPHGCVEQTISGAFPQLFVGQFSSLTAQQNKAIASHVNIALEKLKRYQTSMGGLSYWPGVGNYDDWGSSYALHFIVEAEKKGYTIPVGLKEPLINAQISYAKQWDNYTATSNYFYHKENQAYRLFTLALVGKQDLAQMNRLKEVNLNTNSTYLLAAAYHLAGKESIGKSLIQNISPNPSVYQFNAYTYGSTTRDYGLLTMCLSIMNQRNKAQKLIQRMGDDMSSSRWYSTQTIAYNLIGLSYYMDGKVNNNQGIQANLWVDGKKQAIATTKEIYTHDIQDDANHTIQVQNNLNTLLFVTLISKGAPAKPITQSAASELVMRVTYADDDGNVIDVSQLKQGTDFNAKVYVYNPGNLGSYTDLALTHLFPAGWEILNMNVFDDAIQNKNYKVDYQDVRDDRVLSYFGLSARSHIIISVRLNAAYKGSYMLPAVSCEAMYNNNVSAVEKGGRVSVL